MDTNTGVSLAAILSGIVGISLNILVLTYIQKLERIHCPCAEHPYRKWIKGYLVAAIVFIAFNMFVPLYLLKADPAVGIAVGVLLTLWVVATLAFYIMSIMYVRFLVKEKCACSEDVRREVLYYWSIIEITLIALQIFFVIFIGLIGASAGMLITQAKGVNIDSLQKAALESTTSPLSAVARAPSDLHKGIKKASRTFKSIAHEFSSKRKK